MINGIGKSGAGRIELQRASVGQADAASPAAGTRSGASSGSVGGVVAELVAMGPPVDDARVAEIRAAIAEGRYTIDPDAIAERMMADLA